MTSGSFFAPTSLPLTSLHFEAYNCSIKLETRYHRQHHHHLQRHRHRQHQHLANKFLIVIIFLLSADPIRVQDASRHRHPLDGDHDNDDGYDDNDDDGDDDNDDDGDDDNKIF